MAHPKALTDTPGTAWTRSTSGPKTHHTRGLTHPRGSVSADELIKQADMAMYSAKRSRRVGLQTFSPELCGAEVLDTDPGARLQPISSGAAAVRLLAELRRAIDRSELQLLYQPKFDAKAHEMVGVEALLRWPHPERGLLGPGDFLPLVRRHGLMDAITDLVVTKALEDSLNWHRIGLPIPIAINLFAPSLRNPLLGANLCQALAQRGLTSAALSVEVTEDLLVDDFHGAKMVLNDLRDKGIRVAIDDFGTGYSAVSYLAELPIDEIKLDRSTTAAVLVESRSATVVESLVGLAHQLGFVAVAEGVENAAMADRLRDLGCDVLQGYHFSPPVSADKVVAIAGRPAGAMSTDG